MSDVLHVVVGPEEHGVVLHGVGVARSCGDDLLRLPRADDLDPAALGTHRVVHVPFADRLFGATAAEAGAAFARLAEHVASTGAALSVTLHDVPHDDSALQRRRRTTYEQVLHRCRGAVVNSRLELSLVEGAGDGLHSLQVVPLPVPGPGPQDVARVPAAGSATPSVVVLGFLYPDRGHEEVLAALPQGAELIAVGRPSLGHEDLPGRYAQLAADSGARWRLTGYLPDAEFAAHAMSADVPVAPNRRITASASINTWLSLGRRPLVPDCAYTRELELAWPGSMTRYDPDDPAALREAIRAALADPGSTWLADGVRPGPDPQTVARLYRAHLDSCVPAKLRARGPHRIVPGNRHDLLARSTPPQPPTVSVVIPWFEQQHSLDLVLAGLSVQTHPADRLEIVVVDDGSARPPDTSCAGAVPVRVRRQSDRGFRAARARNVGAAAADGEILAFLDADTVPEPGYVEALTRLPAVCPDAVTVGRRRHARMDGLGPADIRRRPPTPERMLTEPAWLAEAYARSQNLLDVDVRSYRYVISAVLGIHARLFAEIGGFDERFVGYGGEDWEFAHRAYVAGAVLAHVPEAVAWHDGPDWADREAAARPDGKNREALALAALLPDPARRGAGQWSPYPSVVVRAGSIDSAALLATVRSAFAAGVDCAFWVDEVTGPHAGLVLLDPRVTLGEPPRDVLARAPFQARLSGGAELSTLPELCASADRHGHVVTPAVQVWATRALRRGRRWAAPGRSAELSALLFGTAHRTGPAALSGAGLERSLARLAPPTTA